MRHYSAVFNSVEGNTTFYASPNKQTVESWKTQVTDDFRFCFKLPGKITHQNNLRYSGVEVSDFLKCIEPLGENIGPYMIQLPEGFGPDQLKYLDRFLTELPSDYDFSVEVRHMDFFNRGDEEKALNQLLSQHDVDRVCFDSRALFSKPANTESEKDAHRKKPRLPVHAINTSNHPIIRFVGSSDAHHNEQYLLPWVKKITDWNKQGVVPTLFIHAPDNSVAPVHAASSHQLLSALPGWKPLSKTIKDEMQLAIF